MKEAVPGAIFGGCSECSRSTYSRVAISQPARLSGRTILPGTDAGEFSIEYVTGYGQPIQRGTVTVIPEPAAVVMLLSGLAGLGVLGWRRRRAA